MTTNDVIQHILLSISALEHLINYSVLENLTFPCSLRTCTQFIPNGSQSAHYLTLHYIELHYITLHYDSKRLG